MKKSHLLSAVCACALAVVPMQASALFLEWTGSGSDGSDPLGHIWEAENIVGEFGAWSIPGVGDGTLPWGGSDWISDFHITFFGLPDGVSIDPVSDTRFRNATANIGWDVTITDDTVWFIAPNSGAILDPGEEFFVNILFDGLIDLEAFTFVAEYTMDFVPVPAAAWLFGSGLIGLIGIARRKNAV